MASQKVYDALGRACTKHTTHSAHLNLKVEQRAAVSGDEVLDVKFKLAFNHVGLIGNGQAEPVWFMIDCVFHDLQENPISKVVLKTASLA